MSFMKASDTTNNSLILESVSRLGFLPSTGSVLTDAVLSRLSLGYRFRAPHIAVPFIGLSKHDEHNTQNFTRFNLHFSPMLFLHPPHNRLSNIDNSASLLINVRDHRTVDGSVVTISTDQYSEFQFLKVIHQSFVSLTLEERVLQLDCNYQASSATTALVAVRGRTACNIYRFVYDDNALITSSQSQRSRVVGCWRLGAKICSISSTTLSCQPFLPVNLKWVPGTEQLAVLSADYFVFYFEFLSNRTEHNENHLRLVSQTQVIPEVVDRHRLAWFAVVPLTASAFVLANRLRVVHVTISSGSPVVETLFQLESSQFTERREGADGGEEIRCIEAFRAAGSLLVATTTHLLIISSERPHYVRLKAPHELLTPPVCLCHLESVAPFEAAPSLFPSGDVVLVAGGCEAHLFLVQRVDAHMLLPSAAEDSCFIRQVAPVLRTASPAALLDLWRGRDEVSVVTCGALRARLEAPLCGGALVLLPTGGFVALWSSAAGDLFWQPFTGAEAGFAGCTSSGSQPANCVPLRWHEEVDESGGTFASPSSSSRNHTPSRALLELPAELRAGVRDWLLARAHTTRPSARSLLFGRERASDEDAALHRKRKFVTGRSRVTQELFGAVAAAFHEALAAKVGDIEQTDCENYSDSDPLPQFFNETVDAPPNTQEDRIIHILTNE